MRGKKSHLRATFDLKHAHGVRFFGASYRRVDRWRAGVQIDLQTVIGMNDFQDCLPAQPSCRDPAGSTYHAISAQSSLSHCTTTRPGNGGRLERHDGIELTLGIRPSRRVLPQVDAANPGPSGRDRKTCEFADAGNQGRLRENWRASVSLASWYSQALTKAVKRFKVSGSKDRAFPISRAAERPR